MTRVVFARYRRVRAMVPEVVRKNRKDSLPAEKLFLPNLGKSVGLRVWGNQGSVVGEWKFFFKKKIFILIYLLGCVRPSCSMRDL